MKLNNVASCTKSKSWKLRKVISRICSVDTKMRNLHLKMLKLIKSRSSSHFGSNNFKDTKLGIRTIVMNFSKDTRRKLKDLETNLIESSSPKWKNLLNCLTSGKWRAIWPNKKSSFCLIQLSRGQAFTGKNSQIAGPVTKCVGSEPSL